PDERDFAAQRGELCSGGLRRRDHQIYSAAHRLELAHLALAVLGPPVAGDLEVDAAQPTRQREVGHQDGLADQHRLRLALQPPAVRLASPPNSSGSRGSVELSNAGSGLRAASLSLEAGPAGVRSVSTRSSRAKVIGWPRI